MTAHQLQPMLLQQMLTSYRVLCISDNMADNCVAAFLGNSKRKAAPQPSSDYSKSMLHLQAFPSYKRCSVSVGQW